MALVLTIYPGERVHIGKAIVRVQRLSDVRLRLIIDAPPHVNIVREKVLRREGGR